MPELLSPPLFDQPIEESAPEPVTDDQDVLAEVVQAYDACKRNQEGYETLWVELWNLWRFYKSAESAIKVVDPIGFAMTAGLLSKIFVRPPAVTLTARTGGWKWLSKIIKSYLEYQMDNPDADVPMEEEYISFVTELLVLGTAVGKTSWCTKYVTQYEDQQVVDETGALTMQRVPIRKKAYDDPIFEHVPLESFFIQPGAKSIAEARYVIMEKECDRSYIESLKERLDEGTGEPIYNVEMIESALEGTGHVEADRQDVENARRPSGVTNSTEENKDKFHLLEYWEDDRYVVVLNKTHVIRGPEDNPNDDGKKPFVSMAYTKVPHEFWGIGALEPIADLQKTQNITLTQRLEYVSNLLVQQFAVLTDASVDEDAIIEGYPIVHTQRLDAVAPLNKGSIPQAAFVTAEEVLGAVERTMGISGYQVGAPSAAEDKTQGTKGGIQTIVAESQTRFDLTLRRFEKTVIRAIAQRFLDLDRQYFPSFESKLILVTDSDGQFPVPLTKELLAATEFHVAVVPGSTGVLDKNAKAQSFMQWTEFAMNALPNFNRELAIIEAAEYQDIENPERFIIPMQQMPVLPAPNPEPTP